MNTITLLGRLGKDPEHQTGKSGKSFVKFSLATNDGFGDNKKTNWHSCTAFGKAADLINQYVKKGNELAVSGTLDYSKHEDKFYTNILVSNFTFVGGSNNGQTIESAAQMVDDSFEPAGYILDGGSNDSLL